MRDDQERMLEVYLQEYSKLKDEQTSRIGFRDNLLYVTLVGFGGILSFSVSKQVDYYALLIIPWVCLILGWAYLINDEKITAIGRYIRLNLVDKVRKQIGNSDIESIFGWEIAHRSDSRRRRRKVEQLIIDEITFVLSGAIGVTAFCFLVPHPHWAIHILCWIELVFLAILGIEIFIYADLAKGR